MTVVITDKDLVCNVLATIQALSIEGLGQTEAVNVVMGDRMERGITTPTSAVAVLAYQDKARAILALYKEGTLQEQVLHAIQELVAVAFDGIKLVEDPELPPPLHPRPFV